MLKKITSALFKSKNNSKGRGDNFDVDEVQQETPNEMLHLLKEYEDIKGNPMAITGQDFDRAFYFLEKYPKSLQAKHLLKEMKDANGQRLKGLSYESAVKILTMMPDHPGSGSIIKGIYSIEEAYIEKLTSDVLMFILEIAPDHPHVDTLTQAIVDKNLTNAYTFITKHPYHEQTEAMIRRMFKKDPNIAVLLLQEKLEHPRVDTIIDSMYEISSAEVRKLTPNAIIFVLEIAPDHPHAERLIKRLVHQNYIKAFDFVKNHMEYSNADMMVKAIVRRKPELKDLL